MESWISWDCSAFLIIGTGAYMAQLGLANGWEVECGQLECGDYPTGPYGLD